MMSETGPLRPSMSNHQLNDQLRDRGSADNFSSFPLPKELCLKIFHLLSWPEALNARGVCRKWQRRFNSILPPLPLLCLMKGKGRVIGKERRGATVSELATSNSHLAYEIQGKLKKSAIGSPILSPCSIALYDLQQNETIFYPLQAAQSFFHLSLKHLIIGEKKLDQHRKGSFLAFPLKTNEAKGSKKVAATIKTVLDPSLSYCYAASDSCELIAAAAQKEASHLFVFKKGGELDLKLDLPFHFKEGDWISALSFVEDKLLAAFAHFNGAEAEPHLACYDLTQGKEDASLNLSFWLQQQETVEKIAGNEQLIVLAISRSRLLIIDRQTHAIEQTCDLNFPFFKKKISSQSPPFGKAEAKDLQATPNHIFYLSSAQQLFIIDCLQQKEIKSLPAAAIACSGSYLFVAVPNQPLIQIWNLEKEEVIATLTARAPATKLSLNLKATAKTATLAAALPFGQVQVWSPLCYLQKEPKEAKEVKELNSSGSFLPTRLRIKSLGRRNSSALQNLT